MGVGDEPGAQVVRAVGAGVDAGAGERLLDQGVDGLRVQPPAGVLVVLADGAERGPVGDGGEPGPAGQGDERAAGGVVSIVPRPIDVGITRDDPHGRRHDQPIRGTRRDHSIRVPF